jgi:ERCC4-related helicase
MNKRIIEIPLSEYVNHINNTYKLNYLLAELELQGVRPDFTYVPRITEDEYNKDYDELQKSRALTTTWKDVFYNHVKRNEYNINESLSYDDKILEDVDNVLR